MLHYFKFFLFALIGIANSAFAQSEIKNYPPVTIGILAPIQHHAINEIITGFKEELVGEYSGKITFLVRNAQGDSNLQRSIIQEFKQKNITLIAPIATQSTQMTVSIIRSKPIVGIATKYNIKTKCEKQNSCNMTLVDDEIPVSKQIKFIQEVIPNLNQITLVHSPSDKIIPEVKECIRYSNENGIKVQDLMIQQLSDLYMVSKRIQPNSQAIFILKDNLVASGIQTLINEASKRNIPVITSDNGTVENGAAFAIGVKEYQIGVEGARLAAQILKGTNVRKIPIKKMNGLFVFVNPNAIKRQGMNISKIKSSAKKSGYKIIELKREEV